jgi:hypothetical protein
MGGGWWSIWPATCAAGRSRTTGSSTVRPVTCAFATASSGAPGEGRAGVLPIATAAARAAAAPAATSGCGPGHRWLPPLRRTGADHRLRAPRKIEDTSGYGIFSRRYDSTGTAIGNEFRVNSHLRRDQTRPAIAFDHSGLGDFVVVWNAPDGDGAGVFAQLGFSTTPPSLTCPGAALGGCRTALKSSFDLKDNGDDTKDRFSWRWSLGQATALTDYGDPLGSATRYTLCIYDAGGLEMSAEIPDGRPLVGTGVWTAKSTSYGYKDKAGTPDGVLKAKLTASDPIVDNARISVSGKGENLGLPTPGVTLLTAPVTVQLINSTNSNCFTTTYTGAQVIRNAVDVFKGRFAP